jgi:GT2 family glycosyltransferase
LFKEQVLAPLYPRELRPRKRYARPEDDGAWIGGAFTMFRKDEFEALGGFDERYFLYYEDRDITNRYRRAGLPVRTHRSLVAEHGEGASFADEEADVRRSLWRIMGWLEYVSIWDGRRAAAVALRGLLATYAVIGALLSPVPPRGGFAARMRRKGRELHAVRAAVLRAEQLLPDPAAGAYPDVLALVAERSS